MSAPAPRLAAIDLLRGFAIAEMMVAHFAGYFPAPWPMLVSYTETAMALFVVLAGFMVGWRVVEFKAQPQQQSLALLARAAKILAVHLVLVSTVGMAMFAGGVAGVAADMPWHTYLAQSLRLQNQIGLLHILPTFIPLFLIAPLVLLAIARRYIALLVVASAAAFLLGHINPHPFGYGTQAIFPFVLFQAYFVMGCIAGAIARDGGLMAPPRAFRWLPVALAALAATMFATHLKLVPAGTIQTHPLNLFGLVYHAPLIASVLLSGLAFEPNLRTWPGYDALTRFGRHALPAFVLHVVFAVTLLIANHAYVLPLPVNVAAILLSIVAMNGLLRRYEAARHDAPPSSIAGSVRYLLG